MAEEVNMSEVVEEVRNASEEELKSFIESWYERTRTDGMRIGAKLIAAGVFGAMQKNLSKPKPSLRDYERCMKDIRKILAVQLAKQNELEDAETDEVVEEVTNDGTAEQTDNTDS